MRLLCPKCGRPGINERAGRHPHPVRFCPDCNLVFDAQPDVSVGVLVDEPVVVGSAVYEGLDAAREALNPTPKGGDGAA
jgi:hypothetical protein